MLLNAGDVLQNRYRIVRLIAQGGFGTLYRAWDSALSRPCVIKENLATTPVGQRQFLREAKILANLNHPNLPRVTDHFVIPGQGQYLVMDYVEGQDLQQLLEDRGSPFQEDQVIQWASQICDALTYLHSQTPPVIHRDIKPANIRITPGGQAILVDFGIAKVLDPSLKTTLGAQAVSPGYSPYEQYGKAKTDSRTDIYALGATLYTLVTGEEPPESIQRVIRDPLIPPRQVNRNLSLRTSAALVRAMQLDPTQRFQNAADFKLALKPPPPVQVAQPTMNYQTPVRMLASAPAKQPLPLGWIALVSVLAFAVLFLSLQMINNGLSPLQPAPVVSQSSSIPLNPSQTNSVPATFSSGTQVALMPSISASPEPSLTPLVYLVQSGDTCSEIAEAYGVAIADIVSKNDGMSSDCGVLFTGQTLFIPQPYGPIDTPVSIRSPTLPAPKTTQRSDQDGMRLVFIPGGEFLMGRGETGSETSGFAYPAHEIFLNDFWIDITEVTNKMYARCLQAGACQAPGERSSRTRSVYFDEPEYEDYPVIFVNWDDAQDYCRWAGRRLPSEAEWEKAARGIDDREFPWGNGLPTMRLANFGNLLGDTNRVGSYPNGVSPFGVLDLAGNVAEWVSDWYGADYYAASPYKNPKGPESGDFKILRGGSWFTQAQTLQVTFRLWNYPELRSDTVGFRCAK